MPTPTDLRAALREAAAMLESYSEIGFYSDAAKARAKVAEFRALADAPPTVAELLPMVDATHRVRWLIDGNHREAFVAGSDIIQVSVLGADDRHAQYSDLQVADLTRRGRLVEVSP